MSERLANKGRCDAKALGDERVEYGLECRQHARLPRLHEDAESAPHRHATLVGHLAAHTLVDEKEICAERFGN